MLNTCEKHVFKYMCDTCVLRYICYTYIKHMKYIFIVQHMFNMCGKIGCVVVSDPYPRGDTRDVGR